MSNKTEKGYWLSNHRRAAEYKKSNIQYGNGKVGRTGINSKARHAVVALREGDVVITEAQQRAIRKKNISLPKHKLSINKGKRKLAGTAALLLPKEIVLNAAQAKKVERLGGKLPSWGLQSTPGPIKKRGDKGGKV